ncbi:hypothetical protein DHW03_01655 [Pedobacter yonginense]|uniref:Uncharacterized protein n=1 Tax=Pedobacter yonginense TaxID=651869 RepID=A0A317EPM0_9SPHI|nr:hypothetical protein DHW03_01655 [Pedobacter yonginense]
MHVFAAFKLNFIADDVFTFLRYIIFALVLLSYFFAARILVKQLLITYRYCRNYRPGFPIYLSPIGDTRYLLAANNAHQPYFRLNV